MKIDSTAVGRYFKATDAALGGLETYLNDGGSRVRSHNIIGRLAALYLDELKASFSAWESRIAFTERFRISKAESGFPVYQNILDLANDAANAQSKLKSLPQSDELKEDLVDYILTKKSFPSTIQRQLAERSYFEQLAEKQLFQSFLLPVTEKVSVNPKTGRPYYVVHWAAYDGTKHLPVVYVATIEDCLLYTSPSPRDGATSRMPSSA